MRFVFLKLLYCGCIHCTRMLTNRLASAVFIDNVSLSLASPQLWQLCARLAFLVPRYPLLMFNVSLLVIRSRYSDWLRAGRPRGRSSRPGGVRNFHFSMSSRPALGSTQPLIQWVPGALSSGVKRPGREADHSSPTSSEVKNTWIYTSTPPYVFMA
jgi:hypothetical protein